MKLKVSKNYLLFLITGILFSCASNNKSNKPNNVLNFVNRTSKPIYPHCNLAKDSDNCLQYSIGVSILKEAKRQNLTLKNDTLKIGIRVNNKGSTSILESETNNSELKKISLSVLSSLPLIEPAFSKKQKEYVSVGFSFYLIIKNNSLVRPLFNKDLK